MEERNSQGGEEHCGTVKEARNILGSEKLSRKRGTIKEEGTVKEARNRLGREEQSMKRGTVKEVRNSQGSKEWFRKQRKANVARNS